MPVVGSRPLLIVLQVKRVYIKSVDDPAGLFEPHCGAVKVDEQPFVRVKVKGVRLLDAFHEVAVLGADEGGAGVRRVHVQPDVVLRAHVADLVQRIECARRRGAQCRHNLRKRTSKELEMQYFVDNDKLYISYDTLHDTYLK